jgi:hypothetical protein
VTFVAAMTILLPLLIGTGCTLTVNLHIIHLMFICSVINAFGEQIKPGADGGAGQSAALRLPYSPLPSASSPARGSRGPKRNGSGNIAFLPTGSS